MSPLYPRLCLAFKSFLKRGMISRFNPSRCLRAALTLSALLSFSFALSACDSAEPSEEVGGAQAGAVTAGVTGGEAGVTGGEAGVTGGEAGVTGGEAGVTGGEAGVTGGESPFADDGVPSDQPGRYSVGYQSVRFSYQLPEALASTLANDLGVTPAEASERALRLALWYPTTAEASEHELASYPFLPSRKVALLNAPIAELSARAPLLLYSHGAKVWPELGAFLHEHFASHGWVVAAVEHDLDHLQSATRPRPDAMYLLRPLDVSATLTHLLSPEVSAEAHAAIAAQISPAHVIAAGHSFGGYTSFALGGARYDVSGLEARCADLSERFCEHLATLKPLFEAGSRDERIKLIIPQSSGNHPMFGEGGAGEGVSAVAVPTLHVSAERDQDCTEEAQNLPYWQGLLNSSAPEHRWLSFKQAGHASLTVSCAQFPGLEVDNGCGEDFTPPEQLHDLTTHYALSFARAHLHSGDEATEALELINSARDDELLRFELPPLP